MTFGLNCFFAEGMASEIMDHIHNVWKNVRVYEYISGRNVFRKVYILRQQIIFNSENILIYSIRKFLNSPITVVNFSKVPLVYDEN